MSVFDGVLVAAVLLLFLIILGVMREAVILRGHVTALSQLIVRPPEPSFLGKPLPLPLAYLIPSINDSPEAPPRPHVVLFVSAGCGGCTELVSELQHAAKIDLISANDLSFVVSAASKGAPIFRAAQAVSRNTVLDATGALLNAGEVKGTPSQLAVWSDGLEVFDYKIGGDVEWIRQKLQQRKSPPQRPNGASPRHVLREAPFDHGT